jgi:hypothetical protein
MRFKSKYAAALATLAGVGLLYGAAVIGYQDYQVNSTPGNPASGYARLFFTSSGLGCLTSAGADCLSTAQVNGAAVPASASLIGSNSSRQLIAAAAAAIAGVDYAAGGGTANAQTATYTPAATLTTGIELCWLPSNANSTTTPTFAPNGLTAKTIVKAGGAVAANDLTTTAIACAIYDGTSWELQNPQTATGQFITSLTTTGSSGAATVVAGVLNVPQYSGGGGGSTTAPYAFGSIPACSSTAAFYQLTNSIYNNAYCDGASALHYYYGGTEATPPVDANFSWTNQRGSSSTTGTGGSQLHFPASGSSATNAETLWNYSYPGGNFTVTLGFQTTGVTPFYNNGGLGITDGTKFECLAYGGGTVTSSISSGTISINYFTNSTTYSSSPLANVYTGVSPSVAWMKLQDNGTNRIWSFGFDGQTWPITLTEGRTANLTPTKIGFCSGPQSTQDYYATVFHWKQQ